jgi:uncharacterized protein
MPLELIDLNELPKVPWRNGAGLMREIAVEPRGAGGDTLDWKFSWAETTKNSPFSAFPGLDRSLVLLRGAGLRLTFAGAETAVSFDNREKPLSFKGEEKVEAELIDGPSENLSILLRRDKFWSSATWVDQEADVPPADALFILCLSGAIRILTPDGKSAVLQSQQSALLRKATAGLRIEPVEQKPLALTVRIRAAEAAAPRP